MFINEKETENEKAFIYSFSYMYASLYGILLQQPGTAG